MYAVGHEYANLRSYEMQHIKLRIQRYFTKKSLDVIVSETVKDKTSLLKMAEQWKYPCGNIR